LAAQGFQYDRMMDAALRGVMRDALARAAERGLPGDHHFYITFQTAHPGVQVPATLRQRFPREMTIVLQFQFWGLEVGDAGFSVTLSFDAKHERLVIPFAAVTAFVDPSVQFGLQFQAVEAPAEAPQAEPAGKPGEPPAQPAPEAAAKPDGGERIVKLDAFRKK
jgi:uncharacterized protein